MSKVSPSAAMGNNKSFCRTIFPRGWKESRSCCCQILEKSRDVNIKHINRHEQLLVIPHRVEV